MFVEKRGYSSHFKKIGYGVGSEPRKRFSNLIAAQRVCNKFGNDVFTVFFCSYCNGYHIWKKPDKYDRYRIDYEIDKLHPEKIA